MVQWIDYNTNNKKIIQPTPGPWMASVENPKIVYDDHCNQICCTHSGHFCDEQHIANANFIALAPDMLKSLKGMVESFDILLSEMFLNDAQKGIIRGAFVGEITKAKKIIEKAGE